MIKSGLKLAALWTGAYICMIWTGMAVQAAYNKPYIGDVETYRVKKDDTLVHIARSHGLGYVEIRAANPHVDPWLPERGRDLILPARHILPDAKRKGIVINLPEMRLYAYINGDKAPTTFPIGIGREGLETPIGTTTVTRKKEGPTWRPTARMLAEDPELEAVVKPGPDNPLGSHALYLGWPTYAIHGTNRPYGIGRRISSGCIRLYPENIKELFEVIPVGTKVTVVNQPIKLAWIEGELFLEAHPDMEQAVQMEETGITYTYKMRDQDMDLIMKAAGEHADNIRWPAVRMAIRERAGYPVSIARDLDYIPETKIEDEKSEDIQTVKSDIPKPQDKSEMKEISQEQPAEKKTEKEAQQNEDISEKIVSNDSEASAPSPMTFNN